MMAYAIQERPAQGAPPWITVATDESEEAAVEEAVRRALDSQNTGTHDTSPLEYRVVDATGRQVTYVPPDPGTLSHWRWLHGR